MDVRNSWIGAYGLYNYRRYSATGDFLLIADRKLGDFNVGGVLGGGMTYNHYAYQDSYTSGGLAVPGFYSLNASKELPKTSSEVQQKQTNSIYGKLEAFWKSAIFMEVIGRNDWVSTLEASERSYFYPSVSGSIIPTELIELPDWLNFWKFRSSWTMTKKAAGIYSINKAYDLVSDAWNGNASATYPRVIRDATLKPEKSAV